MPVNDHARNPLQSLELPAEDKNAAGGVARRDHQHQIAPLMSRLHPQLVDKKTTAFNKTDDALQRALQLIEINIERFIHDKLPAMNS